MIITTIICGAATLVVFWKLIGVIASLNFHAFDGHPWQFVGLACHWALVAGGSMATFSAQLQAIASDAAQIGGPVTLAGGAMLVVGMAMMILSDRRSR